MKLACTLIFKELWHRKIGFLLSLVAAIAAVGLCVAMVITQDAAARETRIVTRNVGHNVRIVPRAVDVFVYHQRDYSPHTMPEDYLDKIASQKNISYGQLEARLVREIEINGKTIRLVGLAPIRIPPGQGKKKPMSVAIESGTIHVGHDVSKLLNVKKGDSVELQDRDWKVARVAPNHDNEKDITIFALLSDVQAALDLPGQISEIRAMDCTRCDTTVENPLVILRDELEAMLPQAQVLRDADRANQRASLRQMIEEYSSFIIAALLLVSAGWIGMLAVTNVRERTGEIGLLRALGYGSSLIGGMVLGRAALIGVIGAALGYLLGCYLATSYGAEYFPTTAKAIKSQPVLLAWAMLAAPLLAMIASFIPAALAVSQDPAVALRHE
ncbi:MAG: hypothetical protein DWQ35_07275 [Planctomycetota bacterium]|nr:MAG: hypothetical protein DWQ35_07275 [Planctomycetota bacterium]REK25269.1 MAG: hypothetical protein DWQ42_11745 [Planctomycetota bacterium]